MAMVNPFAKEVVASNYGYPENYQPRSTKNQLIVLQQFPSLKDLDGSYVEELSIRRRNLPQGAELLQVWPKLSVVSEILGIKDPYTINYGICLEMPLLYLESNQNLDDYWKGKLTAKHIRLLESVRVFYKKLEKKTPGDFIVEPIQSGYLYAGHSVQNSRWEIYYTKVPQWSLDPYVVAWYLLTHPERIPDSNVLFIDCPGAECSPEASGDFFCSPFFDFWFGRLGFDCSWIFFALASYGSASGFRR
jgi:hypothetical protein